MPYFERGKSSTIFASDDNSYRKAFYMRRCSDVHALIQIMPTFYCFNCNRVEYVTITEKGSCCCVVAQMSRIIWQIVSFNFINKLSRKANTKNGMGSAVCNIFKMYNIKNVRYVKQKFSYIFIYYGVIFVNFGVSVSLFLRFKQIFLYTLSSVTLTIQTV